VVISDTESIYLYGLDIIAQQQSERLYYVHDGLGSVRQLLDSTGDVEANYAYDPFGVPVVGGDVSNPYQYTGEAWDGEVELLYLRARYYQPEVGRFVSKDPWPGDDQRPGTTNRYVYVMNNPANRTDPMGSKPGDPPESVGRAPTRYQLRDPYASYNGYTVLREAGYSAGAVHHAVMGPFALPSVAADMARYASTGYSRSASVSQAEYMLLAWFLQRGPQKQFFGPEYSLTQDVRRSQAVAVFRQQWRDDAQTFGSYRVPYSRLAQSIDQRDGTLRSQLAAWAALVQKHAQLGLCVIGLGSRVAEGGIDPTGAIFGSFNDITVWPLGNPPDRVVFVVHNRMGKASLSRWPGTTSHRWENEPRSETWWGGTVDQYFYWYERNPNSM
jgi:RHS repeat-associated protein